MNEKTGWQRKQKDKKTDGKEIVIHIDRETFKKIDRYTDKQAFTLTARCSVSFM